MALVLVVFAAVNVIHSRWFHVRVVLYDTLLDAVIATCIVALLYYFVLRRNLTLSIWEASLAIVASLLILTNYAVLIPTIVDRSLSIGLLEMVARHGGSMKQEAIEPLIFEDFFPAYDVVPIRITEQVHSGTITIDNGCIRLTRLGRTVVAFTTWFRRNLLPRHRDVLGNFDNSGVRLATNSADQGPSRCPGR
jgi:hypothetical protein